MLVAEEVRQGSVLEIPSKCVCVMSTALGKPAFVTSPTLVFALAGSEVEVRSRVRKAASAASLSSFFSRSLAPSREARGLPPSLCPSSPLAQFWRETLL